MKITDSILLAAAGMLFGLFAWIITKMLWFGILLLPIVLFAFAF